MKKFVALFVFLGVAGFLFAARPNAAREVERYWAQWRGPLGTGVAPHADPPVEWSERKNVRWKAEIHGKGSSSPVVWGDRVFVTTAVPVGERVASPEPELAPGGQQRRRRNISPDAEQEFVLLAFDRRTGREVWRKTLRKELPHEGTHPTGTWASNSPVTDGTHVFAYFGSRGLYALDMKGNLVWEKDLGDMTIKLGFGEGSSPALYGDKLILTWDHEGDSFIVALDKRTGEELWRVPRDERTAWATPLVVEHQGKAQVITNATNRVRSYELETGKLLWEASGMTDNTIPSPVASGGMVYVTSGFRGNALLAIRLDGARGDITGSDRIAWKLDRDTPYVPSPLLYGDTLYILKSNTGILSALNARTGKEFYGPVRLDAIPNVYASPVGAANRVYIVSREGSAVVLAHGPEFKILATNTLDDGFDASPALVDGEIFLRGRKYLYCLARN